MQAKLLETTGFGKDRKPEFGYTPTRIKKELERTLQQRGFLRGTLSSLGEKLDGKQRFALDGLGSW